MKVDVPAKLEITVFRKFGGPPTKRISLAADGSVVSDGSECVMSTGEARRVPINNVEDLAALMANFKSSEAIALGVLRPGVPDRVKVTTKTKLNDAVRNDRIARTADDIIYREGQPALVLFDLDKKGMPPAIAAEIEQLGYWKTLCTIVPELKGIAHVTRRSTSTGLFNIKTGEKYVGSGGVHIYISVADGTDAERFLKALHDRCWLAGFGWMLIGAAGQFLERSIIDRSVGGSERLVFEGPPTLLPPLEQDLGSRKPIAVEGGTLDTITACPPLTIVENAKLHALIEKAKYKVAPEADKARAAFVEREVKLIVARTGISKSAARKVAEEQSKGNLLPEVELPFDDPDFAKCTVGDVLANPRRFYGATMADPLEGVAYGRCKAKVLLGRDGTVFINSFAHGGIRYQLGDAKLRPAAPTHSAAFADANTARHKTRQTIRKFFKKIEGPKSTGDVFFDYGTYIKWKFGDPLAWAMCIDTGIGKTEITIEEISQRIRAGKLCRVVYAVPRHELGYEIEKKFVSYCVDAKVFRGRKAKDPKDSEKLMCLNEPAIDLAMSMLAPISKTCCKSKNMQCKFLTGARISGRWRGARPAYGFARLICYFTCRKFSAIQK